MIRDKIIERVPRIPRHRILRDWSSWINRARQFSSENPSERYSLLSCYPLNTTRFMIYSKSFLFLFFLEYRVLYKFPTYPSWYPHLIFSMIVLYPFSSDFLVQRNFINEKFSIYTRQGSNEITLLANQIIAAQFFLIPMAERTRNLFN